MLGEIIVCYFWDINNYSPSGIRFKHIPGLQFHNRALMCKQTKKNPQQYQKGTDILPPTKVDVSGCVYARVTGTYQSA